MHIPIVNTLGTIGGVWREIVGYAVFGNVPLAAAKGRRVRY